MNPELVSLFDEDQREREFHPQYGTQDYWNLRRRDSERRGRVMEIIEEIGLLRSFTTNSSPLRTALR
jgi:hypothetical protein